MVQEEQRPRVALRLEHEIGRQVALRHEQRREHIEGQEEGDEQEVSDHDAQQNRAQVQRLTPAAADRRCRGLRRRRLLLIDLWVILYVVVCVRIDQRDARREFLVGAHHAIQRLQRDVWPPSTNQRLVHRLHCS